MLSCQIKRMSNTFSLLNNLKETKNAKLKISAADFYLHISKKEFINEDEITFCINYLDNNMYELIYYTNNFYHSNVMNFNESLRLINKLNI